jgi:hypothetical protein
MPVARQVCLDRLAQWPARPSRKSRPHDRTRPPYALMPHVKITELLAKVDQWTSLGDRFLHLRTQAPAKVTAIERMGKERRAAVLVQIVERLGILR